MISKERKLYSKSFKIITYFLFIYNSVLNQLGLYEGPFISYFIVLLIPFCLDGAKIGRSIWCIFAILACYKYFYATINIFLIFYIVYLFRYNSISYIAKVSLHIYFTIVLLILLLLCTGTLTDTIINYDKGIAHTFGFKNSNSLGLQIFYLFILLYAYVLKYNRKIKFISLLLILLVNQIFFELIHSRTAWISSIVLCFFGFLDLIKFFNKDIIKIPIALLPLFLSLLVFAVILNPIEFYYIDEIFSGRLSVLSQTVIFMNGIDWITGRMFEDIPIDCSYLGMIYIGGIFWFLFFLFMLEYSILKKFKEIKSFLPIVVSMLVSGISENTFCSNSCASIILWEIILYYPYLLQENNKSKISYVVNRNSCI